MKKFPLLLIGILGLHLFLLVNLQFTAWPEMVSYPYLVNNGFKLYSDFIHPYPPLLTLFLSGWYRVFGYQLIALKALTWGVILVSDVLIYLSLKKLMKSARAALVGVLFYALLQPFLEGNQLWFDLAIVPFVLAGFYFWVGKKYFWSGLMLGLAALIKQTTGLYLVVGGLWLVAGERDFEKWLGFWAGPGVLAAGTAIWLILQGTLGDFLNWNLVYPFTFWTKFPGYVQFSLSEIQLMILVVLVVPLILFGSKLKGGLLVIVPFLISLLLIYPRFSFFHFQLALAFLVILYGVIIAKAKLPFVEMAAFLSLLLLVVVFPVLGSGWRKEARFWGAYDMEMGKIIANKVKGEKVYLLGPHSLMYVFSGTAPPKPWSDNFGWYLEIPGVQEEMITRWQDNPPGYIYWVNPSPGNWFDLGTYQPQKITKWISDNYRKSEEIRRGMWIWEKK